MVPVIVKFEAEIKSKNNIAIARSPHISVERTCSRTCQVAGSPVELAADLLAVPGSVDGLGVEAWREQSQSVTQTFQGSQF